MYSTRVFALLALFVGLAHSFSWDIVVAENKRLEFYYKGNLTHTEVIPSVTDITSVTYDPVNNRVLFADVTNKTSISSFDLSTNDTQPLFARASQKNSARVVYDPVTQLMFWKEYDKIYSLSLNPASSNEAVDVKLLFTLKHPCYDIALDSCGGYIYWITDYEIERARFNSSDREVLIKSYTYNRRSIAIDQQTKKMYWTEKINKNDNHLFIESADLSGQNRIRYSVVDETFVNSLAVSKDFIYWRGGTHNTIYQLPKNRQPNEKAKLFLTANRICSLCHVIAANYAIEEQTQGIHNCKPLKSLVQCKNLCVHGTKVSGESRCECKPGYTGERCDVSLCHNYCLHGDCSISAEGQPKCSCIAGHSGERCQVSDCEIYCSNNGTCTLNEDNKPVCKCTSDYVGAKCDVPAFLIKWIQTFSMLKDILNADIPPVTLGKE